MAYYIIIMILWVNYFLINFSINLLINETMKTKTQIKAAKSFDYACRQASNCRHDKYQESCFSCKYYDTCDIQKRIENARKKM
jgi:hypothetical protein